MMSNIVSRALAAAPPPDPETRDPAEAFRAFLRVVARFVSRRRGADTRVASRRTN